MKGLEWTWLRAREELASPTLAERVERAARRIDRVAAELDEALADLRQTRRGDQE